MLKKSQESFSVRVLKNWDDLPAPVLNSSPKTFNFNKLQKILLTIFVMIVKLTTKQLFVRVDNILFEYIVTFSMNENSNRFEVRALSTLCKC